MRVFTSLAILLILPLGLQAQTGVITGRVVSEDGGGMPNVTVFLNSVGADRRTTTGASQNRAYTDDDGNFRFTGLAPRLYSISASASKGYVPRPVPVAERPNRTYYRIGDNVTITMVKGGAITGRVTNALGEPVIGLRVTALMVRDAEGNPSRGGAGSRFTDDRGIYRLYGLPPGTYVVYTQGNIPGPFPTPYDGDAPTYHPSSTRETAAEVTVTSGGEASGIDIRYRGDRGHVVTGTVSGGGPSSPYTGINVSLTNVATGAFVGSASAVQSGDGVLGFAVYGVTDGEYLIRASRGGYNEEERFASSPRRITVKGADVSGIELKLLPLGSIARKFAVEASPNTCESKRKWSWEETLLSVRSESKLPITSANVLNALTEKGEFTVHNLEANRYFLEPRLPNEHLYVKTITAAASTNAPANARGSAVRSAPPLDVARNGITLKTGEKFTGVTITIADGAAGVSGKVVPPVEGSRLPTRMRVHLAPAEVGTSDNVLRYAETFARGDGSFVLNNIAPGKYWLIARPVLADEPNDRPPLPLAWDANERAKLRREAEAMRLEVELKPCQRASDQVIKYLNK